MHNQGDECYYILEGDPIAFNPEAGEVYQLHAGDVLYIPQGTWHQIFNFTDKIIKAICCIAPKIWVEDDEMGTEIKYTGKPKFFKSEEEMTNGS